MEVVDARAKLLTNAEVAVLIKDVRHRTTVETKEKGVKNLENLSTVLYQTDHYLKTTPCASQTPEQLQALGKATKSFKLTKAEFIQICNLRPTSPVEVQLIVEECEERLTEEQVEQLITAVVECLPETKADEGEKEEVMEQET